MTCCLSPGRTRWNNSSWRGVREGRGTEEEEEDKDGQEGEEEELESQSKLREGELWDMGEEEGSEWEGREEGEEEMGEDEEEEEEEEEEEGSSKREVREWAGWRVGSQGWYSPKAYCSEEGEEGSARGEGEGGTRAVAGEEERG